MASFSLAERQALAKRGLAMPDGSFPIPDVASLRDAIKDVGRAHDPAAAKQWIVKSARRLQAKSELPLSWL